MAAQGLHQSPLMTKHIGFLTIIDQNSSGPIGGYLVLNRSGRPLEFHCTLPVVPEKLQAILYGNTLQPFLFGEMIAHTLLQRTKLPVSAVFTNQAAVLPVQSLASVPILYVFGDAAVQTTHEAGEVDANEHVSEPPREISAELSESLKTFNIEHHYRTKSASPNEAHRIPHVSGLDTGLWQEVHLGNRSVAVPEKNVPDRERLVDDLKELARMIDYLEPFDRIRRALDEAKNAA